MNINRVISGKKCAPYMFLLPFIVFFLIFRFWPILWSLGVSFFKYDISGIPKFIGFGNYIQLFTDATFRKATINTIYFVVIYNVTMISISIVLAVLLNSSLLRGRKIFRSIYFIPIAMSLPVVAIVFEMIFAKNIGLISVLFNMFGSEYNLRLFREIDLAMWGIIMMRIWRGIGYYCAYFLAGLASIPEEIYESANIDGSGPVTTFFHITLPLLKPMLMFVVIMSTMLSFQVFDEPWIITQGGPANSTLTLQIYLFQTSFLEGNLGKGSAVAYIMTLLMMGLSILYVNRLAEKGEDQQYG